MSDKDVADLQGRWVHQFGLLGAADAKSGKLYVLENNSGGNVWAFSRKGSATLQAIGRKALVTQFMAFDRAAEILAKKTHELAR